MFVLLVISDLCSSCYGDSVADGVVFQSDGSVYNLIVNGTKYLAQVTQCIQTMQKIILIYVFNNN